MRDFVLVLVLATSFIVVGLIAWWIVQSGVLKPVLRQWSARP